MSSGSVGNSQHLLEPDYLCVGEDAVGNNLKALSVIEVLHFLPAFTVPLET